MQSNRTQLSIMTCQCVVFSLSDLFFPSVFFSQLYDSTPTVTTFFLSLAPCVLVQYNVTSVCLKEQLTSNSAYHCLKMIQFNFSFPFDFLAHKPMFPLILLAFLSVIHTSIYLSYQYLHVFPWFLLFLSLLFL